MCTDERSWFASSNILIMWRDAKRKKSGRKKIFRSCTRGHTIHTPFERSGSRKKRKEKRNLTRISHFSSERRGIRIFRENSGRPSSETRDRAYVCSTLLVEIEFKTWRSLSLFLSLTHLYHFCNPLTSNVVFRSTVTRRRNVFINPRIEIVTTSNTFDIFPLDSKVIFYISRFFFLLLNKK